MEKMLRLGTCQTSEIIANIDKAINCIMEFSRKPESEGLDLLLFPECFLQGYVVHIEHFKKYALAMDSDRCQKILISLKSVRPTIIVGFIERDKDSYYNSAMVIKDGILQGVYRKNHLLPGEKLFKPGYTFPVFNIKGIKYGINICYDTQFADSCHKLAQQGAKILLVPAQNMMKRESAEKWKCLHNEIRIQRAKETKMWIISSDVTGLRGKTHVAYGPTAIITPEGKVMAQVPLMHVGMVSYTIPIIS